MWRVWPAAGVLKQAQAGVEVLGGGGLRVSGKGLAWMNYRVTGYSIGYDLETFFSHATFDEFSGSVQPVCDGAASA